ncbi:MAG: hypothetical protein LBQ24_02275 [Candidatus Peribacteria bacterium]|jgi:hypothetical protein|nr:hypothetical protein [Candidatus Peribacteria bacterium]
MASVIQITQFSFQISSHFFMYGKASDFFGTTISLYLSALQRICTNANWYCFTQILQRSLASAGISL